MSLAAGTIQTLSRHGKHVSVTQGLVALHGLRRVRDSGLLALGDFNCSIYLGIQAYLYTL